MDNNKMEGCFFAGTFDPITKGHLFVIKEAIKRYNKVVIGIGVNNQKAPFFSVEERKKFILDATKGLPVEVAFYDGYTVDYMQKIGLKIYVRGIRDEKDEKFESLAEEFNKARYNDLITVRIKAEGEYSFISSSKVKELIGAGDFSALEKYLPEEIVGEVITVAKNKIK